MNLVTHAGDSQLTLPHHFVLLFIILATALSPYNMRAHAKNICKCD